MPLFLNFDLNVSLVNNTMKNNKLFWKFWKLGVTFNVENTTVL